MGKLVLDKAMQSKLATVSGVAELCDEQGRTVGYYVSAEVYQQFPRVRIMPEITDEELEEARREEGGVTTEELLAYLKSLDNQTDH
jgi:3-hydroxyacyl-CoA dehydrogenase